MSRCGDCKRFDECKQECRDLSENETFSEVGGCGAFKSKDENTYKFLPFSMRFELTGLYEKWAKEHNAKECPFNVISYLCAKKLIDTEKAIKFIHKEQEKKET